MLKIKYRFNQSHIFIMISLVCFSLFRPCVLSVFRILKSSVYIVGFLHFENDPPHFHREG